MRALRYYAKAKAVQTSIKICDHIFFKISYSARPLIEVLSLASTQGTPGGNVTCSGKQHNKEHLKHARRYSSGSVLLQLAIQEDHNTRTGERLYHHCKMITTPGLEKGPPPLLIQCKEITTPGLEKGSTTTAHPIQGDHNTRTGERLNHHCSSNARRSQHQDWRKAQPPLLTQCKEITTPGLVKGSTTTAHPMQGDHNTRTGERLNHHCSSNARRSQHQDWRKAQPPLLIQCKEITTPGLEKGSTTTAHPMQGDHNTRTGERLNHHYSSNARRSQHQDWRKAQPPLLIQCKEITTSGLNHN